MNRYIFTNIIYKYNFTEELLFYLYLMYTLKKRRVGSLLRLRLNISHAEHSEKAKPKSIEWYDF